MSGVIPSSGRRTGMRLAGLACVWLATTACEGPDLGLAFDFERMLEQPRYDAYGASSFFDDGMAMRIPPAGTVPYRPRPGPGPFPRPDEPMPTAPRVTRELLEQGRSHFEVICGACHGVDGQGHTPVAERMALRPPPSFDSPRLRGLSREQIHAVIEHGYGLMPAYADLLRPRERWAVAEYAKVLQASRHVRLAALPEDARRAASAALAESEEAARAEGSRGERAGEGSP